MLHMLQGPPSGLLLFTLIVFAFSSSVVSHSRGRRRTRTPALGIQRCQVIALISSGDLGTSESKVAIASFSRFRALE